MPAVTDLTWSQINDALKSLLQKNEDLITIDTDGNAITMNIAEVSPSGFSTVIKFMNIMHDAAVIAQTKANTGKLAGEKLNTFAAPISGTPVNNFVPMTRTIVSRVNLQSVASVIGINI